MVYELDSPIYQPILGSSARSEVFILSWLVVDVTESGNTRSVAKLQSGIQVDTS